MKLQYKVQAGGHSPASLADMLGRTISDLQADVENSSYELEDFEVSAIEDSDLMLVDIELVKVAGPFVAKDDVYDAVSDELTHIDGIENFERVFSNAEWRAKVKAADAEKAFDGIAIAASGSKGAHFNAITTQLGGVPIQDEDGNLAAETGNPIATTPDGHVNPYTGKTYRAATMTWEK